MDENQGMWSIWVIVATGKFPNGFLCFKTLRLLVNTLSIYLLNQSPSPSRLKNLNWPLSCISPEFHWAPSLANLSSSWALSGNDRFYFEGYWLSPEHFLVFLHCFQRPASWIHMHWSIEILRCSVFLSYLHGCFEPGYINISLVTFRFVGNRLPFLSQQYSEGI